MKNEKEREKRNYEKERRERGWERKLLVWIVKKNMKGLNTVQEQHSCLKHCKTCPAVKGLNTYRILEVRIIWSILDWKALRTADCILCYITSWPEILVEATQLLHQPGLEF